MGPTARSSCASGFQKCSPVRNTHPAGSYFTGHWTNDTRLWKRVHDVRETSTPETDYVLSPEVVEPSYWQLRDIESRLR